MAYHFQQAGSVSPTVTTVFYVVAMAVSGTGSLVFGRVFDRAGIGILIRSPSSPRSTRQWGSSAASAGLA